MLLVIRDGGCSWRFGVEGRVEVEGEEERMVDKRGGRREKGLIRRVESEEEGIEGAMRAPG